MMANHHIRAWRKFRRMSVRSLAQQAGLAASTIGGLETGSANYSQQSLEKIAAALQVAPAQLLSGPPNRPAATVDPNEGQIVTAVEILKTDISRAASRATEAFLKRVRGRS